MDNVKNDAYYIKRLKQDLELIEYVIKRDGRKEPFDPEKLNGWAQWAEKTINSKDFNWSTIVMRAIAGQSKRIHAKDLQEALVRECLNQNSWEGSRMAGRLYASMLPKELYKNRVVVYLLTETEKDILDKVKELSA